MKIHFPSDVAVVQSKARSRHNSEFWINRPSGSGDYVFLFFNTPIVLRDVNGTHQQPHNTCILYAPGFYQFYGSRGPDWDHAWFHLSGESLPKLIADLEIPINTAMQIGDLDFVVPSINSVTREQLRSDQGWQEIVSMKACEFFLLLRRAMLKRHNSPVTHYQHNLEERFRSARETIHHDLARTWTVKSMSELTSVSQSHFAALYRQYFGTSPIEDLIQARVNQAAYLLKSTNYSIKQIGELTGFNSAQMFSSVFKLRKGASPKNYRLLETP